MNAGAEVLFYFCIALIPSVIGAISGIGGGIIIKPALDAVTALGPREINVLSGTTVLTMSLVSLLRRRKQGAIPERRGTALALGAALGGIGGQFLFGRVLAAGIRPTLAGMIQSVLLIILTGMAMVYMRRKGRIVPVTIRHPPFCAVPGLALGCVSAFLGIGGGPVNIMAISYFLGTDSKSTALYSLYTIFLAQSASLVFSILSGTVIPVNRSALIPMMAGGIAGGIMGSRIVRNIRNEEIDRLFFMVLAAVMLLSFYNLVRFTLRQG